MRLTCLILTYLTFTFSYCQDLAVQPTPYDQSTANLVKEIGKLRGIEIASAENIYSNYFVIAEKVTNRQALVRNKQPVKFIVDFGKYSRITRFNLGYHNLGFILLIGDTSNKIVLFNLKNEQRVAEFDGFMPAKELSPYIVVKDKKRFGVIDTTGSLIHPTIYKHILTKGNNFYLLKGDTVSFRSNAGAFNEIYGIKKLRLDLHGCQVFNGKFWGLTNEKLELTTPLMYDSLLFTYSNDLYVAKKNGKYGIIDIHNSATVPVMFVHVSNFEYCGHSYFAGIEETKVIVYGSNGMEVTQFQITKTEFENSKYISFNKTLVRKLAEQVRCDK